ncbi:M50 family metallopeptidase [Hymenobacter nivis]|nr:M50 family metallopeptidase [Hymenobacter nivis]
MKNLRKLLFLVLYAALGAALGTLGAKYGLRLPHHAAWGRGQAAGLLALLPVAWLLAVLLHELGHVLAGQWQGFRFCWLAVGPLLWKREAGRLRLAWNTNLNLAGGMALCLPPPAGDLRRRFMAFAAGGPLGSAAWAATALGTYALLPIPASAVGQVLAASLAASGSISALLTLLTLIPVHVGGFYSDGSRLLHLWRGDAAGQLDLALLTVMAHSTAGTRPRHLPQGPLAAAAALPPELPMQAYAHYYRYLGALDAQQIAQAGQHLAAYRTQLLRQPVGLQASGWLESAFFAAAYEYDLPTARAFRARAQPSVLVTADVLARVEAALARLAGEPAPALAFAQAALRALPRSVDQGSAHLYAEWLADTVRWAAGPAEPPLRAGGSPGAGQPLAGFLHQ